MSVTTVTPLPMGNSNAYLLRGEQAVLVDAGGPEDGDRLRDALSAQGLQPRDIALVLLTHGHNDHSGTAASFAEAGVPIAVGLGTNTSCAPDASTSSRSAIPPVRCSSPWSCAPRPGRSRPTSWSRTSST